MRLLCLAIVGATIAGCQPETRELDESLYSAGRIMFRNACEGCHNTGAASSRLGPHLYRIVGRDIAAAEGFDYSEAALASNIVWTEEELNAFLRDPLGYLPGTMMGTAGITDDYERQALIYYLAQVEHAD